MDKRPTIKDVAARAGVSKSTVSLVLQNSALVKDETRVLVRQAAADLGYVRNRAAATLRGAGTGLVGLVINDLRNPFFTEFATSAQMAFAKRGYATVIANSDEDPKIQETTIAGMLEHDVSALLISPCYGGGDAALEAIDRAGIPALQVLRNTRGVASALPFFSYDYAKGSILAMGHLRDAGLRRIAFVGGLAGRDITAERQGGYLEGMRAMGVKPLILPGRATRAFGRAAAAQLLRDHPQTEGAICFNDLTALGLMAGLAEAGKTPGRDMAVVGFDDIEEAQLSHPRLTSIRCDIEAFGARAAEIVMTWLDTGTPPPALPRVPVSLQPRASSRR
ncbi:LacI family DNA-binding transcriptional regulator [Tropicimonas sp. S265A]|uniref:LacI family DNA-binding transcriptional regulator n=1 Tax=Tropicimonas sp. S265A TaxID=3415134 RepID=UPI003C7CB0B0